MSTIDKGPAWGASAPILVIHFDGAIDAGAAGHIAVRQMMTSLQWDVVASFSSDDFLDYRSHRPILTMDNWVTTNMDLPQIRLDRVADDLGRPFLLLHGPEPDMKWEAFAQTIATIARDAGVEITVSLHGIPAGTPHTRPAQVHVQATSASLVPAQPQMLQPLQFPAPLSSFIQQRLAEGGIDGIALIGSVPFYMSERAYPAVSSAMLGKLAAIADLALPVGDLEQGAAEESQALDQFIADSPEIAATVRALEAHYDALTGPEGMVPLGSLGKTTNGQKTEEDKTIGDVIEAYLANVTRTAKAAQASDAEVEGEYHLGNDDGQAQQTLADTADSDTEKSLDERVRAALERVERRKQGLPGDDNNGQTPRHRA
ncbi:PAC2 family protein [Schaalia suimastitidis]|uniref:PAC2 family protein n=1 Tax=Schaalia suimastitidis TaxID=121163 RepID=UPI0004278891|nr:PAC2 family protein [Schaalia suimastitidis]